MSERSLAILLLTALPVSVVSVGALYFQGPVDFAQLQSLVLAILILCSFLDDVDRHREPFGGGWPWSRLGAPITSFKAGSVVLPVDFGEPECQDIHILVVAGNAREYERFRSLHPEDAHRMRYVHSPSSFSGYMDTGLVDVAYYGTYHGRDDIGDIKERAAWLGGWPA